MRGTRCTTCETYELMGFGQACPCIHVEGKCTTTELTRFACPTPARSQRAATLTEARDMDNNTIYAIYDNVAKAIVGMLTLHKHEASAVRMYADIASMPDSQLNKHPQDFDLVRLGYLKDHKLLDPAYAVILKGSVYAAAHTNEQPLELAK